MFLKQILAFSLRPKFYYILYSCWLYNFSYNVQLFNNWLCTFSYRTSNLLQPELLFFPNKRESKNQLTEILSHMLIFCLKIYARQFHLLMSTTSTIQATLGEEVRKNGCSIIYTMFVYRLRFANSSLKWTLLISLCVQRDGVKFPKG